MDDARPFLRRSKELYDAIFMDAYRQPYVPFYLAPREFFALARNRLMPGGVVIVNVGHPETSDALERTLTATLRAVVPHVFRDPAEARNTLLIASSHRPTGPRLELASASMPADLRPLGRRAAARLAPGLGGGEVYTDWLIDMSIIRYAANQPAALRSDRYFSTPGEMTIDASARAVSDGRIRAELADAGGH